METKDVMALYETLVREYRKTGVKDHYLEKIIGVCADAPNLIPVAILDIKIHLFHLAREANNWTEPAQATGINILNH